MVCTVIQGRDLEGIFQALECCEMAEIRLDSCRLSMDDIEECFSSDTPLVATCRGGDAVCGQRADKAAGSETERGKAAGGD
jgi:hypothetical protein